jgi:hypothetical protein
MLSLDDERWQELKGGYRMPFDPRPLFEKLEAGGDQKEIWEELWTELHHQGDVGEASYAAVPHLVRIQRGKSSLDWNVFAIVAVIELAREGERNPSVPEWLADGYFRAIQELAEIGAAVVMRCADPDTVRSMLSVIAIAKGLPMHGKYLVSYSEEEMRLIESGEWGPNG